MKSETPPFYYYLADEIDSDSKKPLAIVIARYHAKTTLIKASIIKDFCYSHWAKQWGFTDIEFGSLFYAWISKSQDDSKDNVKYVSRHLNNNEKLKYCFGDGASLKGDIWNLEDITTKYGDRLMSSSNLKNVRGKTEGTIEFGSLRFNRIFADDFETEMNTKTFQSRLDLKRILLASVLPALDITLPRSRLICVGTPTHELGIMQGFIEKYNELKKISGALDKHSWKIIVLSSNQPTLPGGVLWKSLWNRTELDKKKAELKAMDMEHLYYQEFELKVSSSASRKWSDKHIMPYEGKFIRANNGLNYICIEGEYVQVLTFGGCDPATDIATQESDYLGITVVGVDVNNVRYGLYEYENLSMPNSGIRDRITHELINEDEIGVADKILEVYEMFNCKSFCVEDVGITRGVLQEINKLKSLLNLFHYVIIPEQPAGKEKHNKIYRFFNPIFTHQQNYLLDNLTKLIEQILSLGPRMGHDDILESYYYANLYAYPPNARELVPFIVSQANKFDDGDDIITDGWRDKFKQKHNRWITL